MKDKIGQEIKVGDFIAYGCSLDRSAGLQLGQVIGFKTGKGNAWNSKNIEKIQIRNEQGTKTCLSFPERCVVISSLYDGSAPVVSHYGWNREPKPINWTGEGPVTILGGGAVMGGDA